MKHSYSSPSEVIIRHHPLICFNSQNSQKFMPKIYFIRHGQAAATWDQDEDPPLSPLGQQQAEQVSLSLLNTIPNLDEIQIISSPIKRAFQTAQPFVQACQKPLSIEKAVSEIPSAIENVSERMPWLLSIMQDRWQNLGHGLLSWRQQCLDYLSSLEKDSVIFSHYIAINVAIGHCQKTDEVICYRPDNTSIHIFENKPHLQIISLGKQAITKIN